MPFLRAATRNLSPESSAQCKDFNLKRVLFYRGNHGRLFQQNRPKAVFRKSPLRVGQRRSSIDRRSGWSDFCLFRHFQGVIDLDSQVSDGAFKLRMTKQELDRSQVLRPAIDQRCLGSP